MSQILITYNVTTSSHCVQQIVITHTVIGAKTATKTTVIMVIKIEIRIFETAQRIQNGMIIEYLKRRADLNFEVDFRVNGIIGTIATKWDLI